MEHGAQNIIRHTTGGLHYRLQGLRATSRIQVAYLQDHISINQKKMYSTSSTHTAHTHTHEQRHAHTPIDTRPPVAVTALHSHTFKEVAHEHTNKHTQIQTGIHKYSHAGVREGSDHGTSEY